MREIVTVRIRLDETSLIPVLLANAPIPVPTKEVQLVGQTFNTFVFWSTHLVKHLSEHVFHLD